MIGELRPYPAYLDSGVAWLGEVPGHWERRRLKNLLRPVDVRTTTGKEQLLSLRRSLGIVVFAEHFAHPPQAATLVGYKLVSPDQVVVNRLQANNGLIFRSQLAGLTSPDYSVFDVYESADPEYLACLLRSPSYRGQFRRIATGLGTGSAGFLRLYDNDLLETVVWLPPLSEQTAIVRFLDHADRRIRRAVHAKRRLIALLNEQKQAVIHRAVTRGLDPDVPLKPTGNTWFPDIPDHWDLLPMRRVITRAVDGPHHSPDYSDEGIPFISARNIKSDRWSLSDVKYISESDYHEFSKRVIPEVGDVLYTKGGTTGVARAVDLSFRFQVWVHIAVLKLNKAKITPHYLAMALNSPRCYEQAQLFTRGATNQDLGLGRMKDIVLPVPSVSEQNAIIEKVKLATGDLDSAIAATKREIDLLLEFRTRLIADVVTGKLDVRGVAAGLPETTPGQATLDAFDAPAGDEEDAWPEPDAALEDGDGIGA